MTLRTAVKAGLAGALVGTGVYNLVRRFRSARGQARIHVLGYHRVVDRVIYDGPISPSLCVSVETFRRQMEQVRRRFRVLTLSEALLAIDGKLRLDRDACAITFDDGYRDVQLRAAPVLAQLGIPATVFVSTGFVGSERRFTHDRLHAALWRLGQERVAQPPSVLVDALIARLPARTLLDLADELEERAGIPKGDDPDPGGRALDPTELRALANAGWEVGAHTVDHVVLVHEPEERVIEQLARPRADLESWTGRPCRYFAYCNGYHSPSLVRALGRLGYQGAVTTCDRPNERGGDRFRVFRKVLWEAHARGIGGAWSPTISAAHLHDLFGALGITHPVDGNCKEFTCAK